MQYADQIKRIREKLNIARITDKALEVFGASSHRYIVDEPAAESEIAAFEGKCGIRLPGCYRAFIQHIGNGGIPYRNSLIGDAAAGPAYGIYKLGEHTGVIVDTATGVLQNDVFFNEEITEEQWEKLVTRREDNSSNGYVTAIRKLFGGILAIGYGGGSDYHGMVLNGKDTGRVIYMYDEVEYCPHFAEQKNFLDWYEHWLDEITSGKKIIEDTVVSNGNEDDLVQTFLSAAEGKWRLYALNGLRAKDKLSPGVLSALEKQYHNEADQLQLLLLHILAKFRYTKATDALSKLSSTHPLEFLKIIHWYAKDKKTEWAGMIRQIQLTSTEKDIQDYAAYISAKDRI